MNRILKISLAGLLAASTLAMTAGDSFAMSRKQYCRNVAAHEARRAQGDSVGAGAAVGAGTGGIIGGITGHGHGSNIVTGLALGAIGGAIVGGASGNERAKRVYWETYHDCLGY